MYLFKKGNLDQYLTTSEAELSKLGKSYEDFCGERGVKQGSSGSALAYVKYLQNDNSHEKATFGGKLSARWGLDYHKDGQKIFTQLLAGQNPLTKEQWSQAMPGVKYRKDGRLINTSMNAKGGESIVLAMPKSLSMLYSISDTDQQFQIRKAIKRADAVVSDEMMAKLVRPADSKYILDTEVAKYPEKYKNIKDKYIIISKDTEIMTADFFHYESREVEGHLHLHKQLFSSARFKTKDGKEKVMGIDNQHLYENQKLLTSNFNTILVNELESLGIKTIDDRAYDNQHAFRVAGITRDQELSLSSRSKEFDDIREEMKLNEGAVITPEIQQDYIALKEARRASREEKLELSAGQVHDIIRDKTLDTLTEADLDYLKSVQSGQTPSEQEIIEFDIQKMRDFRMGGVSSEANIKAEIGNQIRWKQPRPKTIEGINQAIQQEYDQLFEKNVLVKMEDGRITTINFIKTEREVSQHIDRLLGQSKTQINRDFEAHFNEWKGKQKLELNAGQEKAALSGCYDNDLLVINAAAGSGKTSTSINYLNSLWTSEAYAKQYGKVQVIGISTQDLTTNALAEAGIETRKNTLAFCSRYYDFEKNTFKEDEIRNLGNANLRLVMDEASMTNSDIYKVLFGLQERVEKQGGTMKMALVGDTNQLASVSCGSSYNYIVGQCLTVRDDEGYCVNYATMDETVRHKIEAVKTIAEAFKQREPAKAMEGLKAQGWWNEIGGKGDRDSRMNALADKMAQDFVSSQRKEKIAIAYSNKDVDLINDAIRKELIKQPNSPIKLGTEKTISVFEKGTIRGSQNQKERDFAVGDEIIITGKTVLAEPAKGGKYRELLDEKGRKMTIENGKTGRIVNIQNDKKIGKQQHYKLTIEIDGKEQTLYTALKENRQFNHSYARTAYSSQGATVDETFVYCGAGMNANAAYVDFSRTRYEVRGYILDDEVERWKTGAARNQEKATTMESDLCQEAYNRYINTPEVVKPAEMPRGISTNNEDLKSGVEDKVDNIAEKAVEQQKPAPKTKTVMKIVNGKATKVEVEIDTDDGGFGGL